MLGSGETIKHYSNLYDCKYFRNRVLRLQALCQQLNLDAILLINGIDATYDEEMKKLANWLLSGLSTSDISGSSHTAVYLDSFFVVSKDGLQAYLNPAAFKDFSKICTIIQNLNIFTLTESEDEDQERQEVLKVAKFYEMIHDKKAVGMPARKLDSLKDWQTASEKQLVEKWPLIQSYGLDLVGQGFFTMNHTFVNVRDALNSVYLEYDAFSKYRIVNEEIERLNAHYFDNWFAFNRDTVQKRMQRTEHDLIESFWLRQEFSYIQKKGADFEPEELDDGLPLSRVLIGQNTNKGYEELSDKETRLYKYNYEGNEDSALHLTMEFVEKNTSLRFARTYFLHNLSQNYMKNCYFSQDEEEWVTSPQGKVNELNARTLLFAYRALIMAYNECSDLYLKGGATLTELKTLAFQSFKKFCQPKFEDINKLVAGPEALTIDVHQIDAYGFANAEVEKCNAQKIIMIRMQVNNLMSQVEDAAGYLGSILFAQSFVIIEDSSLYVNLTENVPNLQSWFTNIAHHESLPREINTEKRLDCEYLGDKLQSKAGNTFYKDVIGLLPIKEEFADAFDDFPLNGKVVFYECGFIFVDIKLNAFVLPYDLIKQLNFYVNRVDHWMEVVTVDKSSLNLDSRNMLPANMISQSKFYLKVGKKFFDDKFKFLEKELMVDQDEKISRAKKFEDQDCPYVCDAQAMQNFLLQKKWNPQYSCDFLNLSFQIDQYKEYMNFAALNEFNRIKNKEFLPFSAFTKVYREANQMAAMPLSKTKDLVKRLMAGTESKTSLVIVSGIPGSGKGRLSDFLSRKFQEEDVPATYFKMPTVQESISYNTEKFVKALTQFKLGDAKAQAAKVIVACLPSYHHLKKAIFELKKNEQLGQMFDLKFVVTKVSAKNFYMSKNRNHYQYLVENCMKGVSNAIVFEKHNLPQNEVDVMQRTLKSANFARNVIMTSGRAFDIDDLAKVVCYQNEKYSILYNKYFYGFEKEGKSAYYLDNAVQGAYFNFRYPLNDKLIGSHLIKALQLPLYEDSLDLEVRQRSRNQIQQEEEDKENEQKRINEMDDLQKKRYLREKKRQAQLEEDLKPEIMLQTEIELTKMRVHHKAPTFERIRAYIQLEDEPEGKKRDTDYELNLRHGDVAAKTLKNSKCRLEPGQLGVLLYGKSLVSEAGDINPMVKEALKCARTLLAEKKNIRTRQSVTEEEIAMLEDMYCESDLPTGDRVQWEYTGFNYINVLSDNNETCYHHPNREFLIARYLDEINSSIGEYNRDVQEEWQVDQQKYD